jgi:hypothetical protein
MDKAKDKSRSASATPKSVKDEVATALGEGGGDFVWVRDDGAVCFGDECVVLKPTTDNTLDMEVKPDRCGAQAGSVILDHLIRTAGRGINIKIAPIQPEEKK